MAVPHPHPLWSHPQSNFCPNRKIIEWSLRIISIANNPVGWSSRTWQMKHINKIDNLASEVTKFKPAQFPKNQRMTKFAQCVKLLPIIFTPERYSKGILQESVNAVWKQLVTYNSWRRRSRWQDESISDSSASLQKWMKGKYDDATISKLQPLRTKIHIQPQGSASNLFHDGTANLQTWIDSL